MEISKNNSASLCLRKNQPALNGVRGIAVLMVFLFHAGVPGFSGSFLGVDIFFVLSGFLITALLLQEYQHHATISLKNFYMRRILRLFPALLLMLACYLIFCYIYFDNSHQHWRHIQDALLALFYAANWTRAFDLNRPEILGHCWSLSIEEQFYFLWPLTITLLLRLSKSWRTVSVALLLSMSWGWRQYLLSQHASWNRLYNGFGCRADMLLAGCLLAMVWHSGFLQTRAKISRCTPLLSAAAVAVMATLAVLANWQASALYQWQYSVVALSTGIIIFELVSRPHGALAKVLSIRPLVWLGSISYGIYLWHYPILYFMVQYGYADGISDIFSALLTLLFALFSWYAVERPALRLKKKFSG